MQMLLRVPPSTQSLIWSVFGFLVTLGIASYWASLAFDESGTGKRRSLTRWIQKPSTLLILLALGITIYTRSMSRLTAMIVVFAFVVRHWEHGALTDIDDDSEID